VVLLPAAADINALWRRSIVLPWGSEMSGRYPFNSTDNDAAIPALGRYLAPQQGEIARFLQQTLGGALVQEGDQWLPSPNLANAAPFDAAFLNAVNSLSRLASRWFTEGDAAFSFELQPVAMPGLVRTELTVDGQTVSYFNQQASWSALRWPGHAQQPGSQLVWESLKAGSRQTLAFNGRWAFIRLLEQAKVEQLDKARYQLDFVLPDGLTARYILRTSAADGPWPCSGCASSVCRNGCLCYRAPRPSHRPRQRTNARRNIQNAASAKAGSIGQQPDNGGGHFLRLAATLHGHARCQPGHPAGFAADGVDAGFDQSGADRIDADAFAGHFAGQPQRQGVDGPLAGGVIDIFAGRPQPGGGRGNIDDDPALPAMAVDMWRTASRQHSMGPATFSCSMCWMRLALKLSSGPWARCCRHC
jgi:hypothetical protein